MALLSILEILIVLFCFLIIRHCWVSNKNKGVPITQWPLIGMLPEIFLNLRRFHDKTTEILDASGGTFLYQGPLFSATDKLVTADTANVHYIMTQNFSNFPKGPKLRRIMDVLGDGIFNSDDESWRSQRKLALALTGHDGFIRFTKSTNLDKVQNGLLPILDHMSAQGITFDLQDLLQRFSFDAMSILVSGHDPRSLSLDLPDIPYVKAMNDVEEAVLYRHFLPEWVWKLMRWLNVGSEKKLSKGWKELDRIIDECIIRTRPQLENQVDMLSSIVRLGMSNDKFLRDTVVNFMIAGRDAPSVTLSWLFWLLSKNPSAKARIREELEAIDFNCCMHADFTKLVHLHGALCETLRLYPPLPFQRKSPLEPDVLPTGHRVVPGSTVLISRYAMGRMRSIWGEDCLEFKPERWITGRGGIKHEPSYKFMAFDAGPRSCTGKELAFAQMKMVAAVILDNYEIEVLGGQNVVPCTSIILHMRHGLAVKVTKRCS